MGKRRAHQERAEFYHRVAFLAMDEPPWILRQKRQVELREVRLWSDEESHARHFMKGLWLPYGFFMHADLL